MKRRRYIYIIIFLVLLAVIFCFKKVSNDTEATLTQENVKADEIKVTFVELGSVGCIPCEMAIQFSSIKPNYCLNCFFYLGNIQRLIKPLPFIQYPFNHSIYW